MLTVIGKVMLGFSVCDTRRNGNKPDDQMGCLVKYARWSRLRAVAVDKINVRAVVAADHHR